MFLNASWYRTPVWFQQSVSVLTIAALLILSAGALFAVPQTAQAATLFSDGFESGDFSNWSSVGGDWDIINDTHAGSDAAEVKDTGSSSDELRKNVSTSGSQNITLSYWYKIPAGLSSDDEVIVQWSNNGGSTWNDVINYDDTATVSNWVSASHVLPSGANNSANFRFRFFASSLSSSDKFRLDDVLLTGDAMPGTIVVNKVVTNNSGGSATASSFSFQVNGGTPIPFEADGSNSLSVAAGTYTITEVAASGYATTYSPNTSNSCVLTVTAGGTATCTITNNDDPVPATISATKIVCDSETDLPNMSGGANITASTAADFLATHPNCELAPDWTFEWAPNPTSNPGDNLGVAGGAWTAFGPTNGSGVATTQIPAGSDVWVREQMQTGYVQFSGVSGGNVSAEIYCSSDVLNYDNYDRISSPAFATTYHCVAFNAVAPGTLVINKVLVNDNGGTVATSSFSFQVNGGTATAFESDGSNSLSLVPGAYTVTEVLNSAYTTTYSEGCTAGVTAGETTTCTITNNDKPGTLIVKKMLPNDNGGTAEADDFSFSVNGGAATPFEADGENELSVDAGTYTIVETNPMTGYTVSYDNCTDVVIGNGGTATCTITNDDQQSSLTVTKVVNNVRESTTYEVGDFDLFVGIESVVSGIAEFFNAGTYAITESGPTDIGYNAVYSGDCAGGSITLGNGETKNCTVTNTEKTPGTLLVIKNVINDEDGEYAGTATESDFTMSVSGGHPAPSSFAGSEEGTTVTIDAGASYSVSEDGPAGYGATYSTDCFGTMPEGGEKTCTVTNNDNPATTGGLTIVKILPNDNGGTATANQWTYYVGETQVTLNQNTQFAGGTYTVSEEGGPSGYSVSFSGDCDAEGNVTVVNGQSKTCVITNDDIAPKLTVTKVTPITNDDGGTKANVSDFSYFVGIDNVFSQVTSGVQGTYNVGTYTVMESDNEGYAWTFGGDCNPDGTVSLALGDEKTCTITNDDLPGTLHVKKVLINDNGGTMATSSFQFLIDDGEEVSDPISFESDGQNDITLPAGTYDITEVLVEGYGASYDGCSDVVIENGGEATCVITNDDGKATLTIKKYTEGADGMFTFSVTGQEDVVLTTEEGYDSESIALDGGIYNVVESVPTGWTLVESYCEYDGEEEGSQIENGHTVYLGVGDHVICTFYNYASGADLSVVKSVSDETPDAGQTITYTVTVSNAGPAAATNVIVSDVLPSGLTYVSDDSEGAYNSESGMWDVGSLSSGASETLVITVTVNSGTEGQQIVNGASVVLSDEEVSDYEEENNEDDISVTVNTPAPTPTPPPGGGGGAGGILGLLGGGGQVLGASTVGEVLGESCGLYMNQHLRRGSSKNNPDQVAKLQEILNKRVNAGLPTTGYFGPLTENAAKAFQANYAEEILAPWGLSAPTGLVYLTTLRQINLLECPELALEVPELIPWSQNPNVQ